MQITYDVIKGRDYTESSWGWGYLGDSCHTPASY